MKKTIITICLLTTLVFAAKPTSYIKLTNLHGNINFNVANTEIVDGNSVTTYIPMVVNLDCLAETADGGRKGVRVTKNVGTPTEEKLEGKDLYDALPVWAQPLLKDLYLEAINENVEQ